MSRFPLSLALVFCAALATVPAGAGEVYVRGTPDGLLVRVPDADLADCELLSPNPFRIVLFVKDLALTSAAPRDRFELARSVRVVGPDILGGNDSRVVIELYSSATLASLEEVGSGVLLSLRLPDLLPPSEEPAPETAVAEEPERPRALTTPWRRAREQAQIERSDTVIVEPVDPADAERERRHAEALERERRRMEREERIAARQQGTEVQPESSDDPDLPASQPPRTRGRRDELEPATEWREPPPPEHRSGVQPSPATPVPGGMVRVPGGAFLMGTPSGDGFEDEEPQHPVDLDPFWIDSHEVSIGDFRRSPVRLPEQPSWNVEDEMPVLNVTWHEAAAYCDWRGQRLPTEAEWEKAARGTEGATYPWGAGWAPDFANTGVAGDGHEHSAPVGAFPDGASEYGALDMAGNAWEWTADWYAPDAYDRRDRTNPAGPSRGAHKVARGGSFRGLYSVNVRSAIRLPLAPSTRRDDVGFRCASNPR